MLVDTHCHLYADAFDADREAVIERAREAGVEAIVMPAIDVPSIYAALELASRHEGLYVMAAIHPTHVHLTGDSDLVEVEALAREDRVVAVGESGLDQYWSRDYDGLQEDVFRWHIRLAAEVGKPLVLHNRDASADLERVLRDERGRLSDPGRLRGVVHCFGGPASLAEAAHEMGFLLGLGGTLTFKNAGVAEAIADVPLERLVLETDAPYLAPAPHRGKRNEPAYVRLVAKKLAAVRGLSLDEVARTTTATARAFFGL